jgi:hypothetical protein
VYSVLPCNSNREIQLQLHTSCEWIYPGGKQKPHPSTKHRQYQFQPHPEEGHNVKRNPAEWRDKHAANDVLSALHNVPSGTSSFLQSFLREHTQPVSSAL